MIFQQEGLAEKSSNSYIFSIPLYDRIPPWKGNLPGMQRERSRHL